MQPFNNTPRNTGTVGIVLDICRVQEKYTTLVIETNRLFTVSCFGTSLAIEQKVYKGDTCTGCPPPPSKFTLAVIKNTNNLDQQEIRARQGGGSPYMYPPCSSSCGRGSPRSFPLPLHAAPCREFRKELGRKNEKAFRAAFLVETKARFRAFLDQIESHSAR